MLCHGVEAREEQDEEDLFMKSDVGGKHTLFTSELPTLAEERLAYTKAFPSF